LNRKREFEVFNTNNDSPEIDQSKKKGEFNQVGKFILFTFALIFVLLGLSGGASFVHLIILIPTSFVIAYVVVGILPFCTYKD